MSSPGRAAKRTRPNLIPMVVNAIAGSEALAGDLRTLLKSTLPIVLKANKEDRHAHEADVVSQAAEALKIVQGERNQAHQVAMGKQNEMIAPTEEKSRKASKKAAEDKLEAAKANVENCKATLKAAEQAEESAKTALSVATKETTDALRKATREADSVVAAAQKEEKQASTELSGIEKKKASLDTALESDFVNLRDGTGGGKAVAKGLLALGREYHLDKTLLDVFATAASKSAEKRSEFETMSFNNLQKLLSEESAKLGQSVAAATPNQVAKTQAVADAEAAKTQAVATAEAAKNAAVDAAKATYEAAKEATKAAEQAEEASKDARSEAGKEATKAETHLRHIWEDMRKACDAQDEAAAHLANLQDDVMAAFEQLKEMKPDEEPAEEEPEPMDLAAPAAEGEAAPAEDAEAAA